MDTEYEILLSLFGDFCPIWDSCHPCIVLFQKVALLFLMEEVKLSPNYKLIKILNLFRLKLLVQ